MAKKQGLTFHRKTCRGCDSSKLTLALKLGKMPLAGGFLTKESISSEPKIPLNLYMCQNCGLFQILDVVDPEILFQNYCYSSSTIKSLTKHFQLYSNYLTEKYFQNGGKLLEFGCNDGVLLQFLKNKKNVFALGIDPSLNISEIARSKGLNVITGYFDSLSANQILDQYGKFDVISGSNVFAHVDNINEILKSVNLLLDKNGSFIIEVHYFLDLKKKFQYDTIYHEHLCYYTITSLKNIYLQHQLKIVDVKHLPMHGGGIRVTAVKQSSPHRVNSSVEKFIHREKEIYAANFISKFKKKVKRHKNSLVELLTKLKKDGKSIVGYGAAGRGTILLNYCSLDKSFLDYIVDSSPLRAGKLMPGVHLNIEFPDILRETPPDYVLIIAWNYAKSILKQENELIKKGVKFIIPFPKPKII